MPRDIQGELAKPVKGDLLVGRLIVRRLDKQMWSIIGPSGVPLTSAPSKEEALAKARDLARLYD
jgi:hypothetical protein